ncbi:hypothetical protein BDZ89DRAFT_701670 [Hymenopellis radicata]|nr:hypothetical protein BDZ89DRAFT_701670 [Hymenopellis radicata]
MESEEHLEIAFDYIPLQRSQLIAPLMAHRRCPRCRHQRVLSVEARCLVSLSTSASDHHHTTHLGRRPYDGAAALWRAVGFDGNRPIPVGAQCRCMETWLIHCDRLGVDGSLLSQSSLLVLDAHLPSMKSLNLKKIQKYAVKNPPVIANAVALPSSPARPPPKTSGTLIEVLFEDDAPIDDSPQDSGAQQSSNANGAALDPENDWEDTVVEGSTKSTFELRRKLYQHQAATVPRFCRLHPGSRIRLTIS